MKNFLGSAYVKTKSFLGQAYKHAPNIHRHASLGLKIGSAFRPFLHNHGHRSRQISNLIGEADTKYHRVADKVEQFYEHNKHNINRIM